jgi:hypothetical protein
LYHRRYTLVFELLAYYSNYNILIKTFVGLLERR